MSESFAKLLRGTEVTKERKRIIKLIDALGCLNDRPSRYAWCGGLGEPHDPRCPRAITEMLRKN